MTDTVIVTNVQSVVITPDVNGSVVLTSSPNIASITVPQQGPQGPAGRDGGNGTDGGAGHDGTNGTSGSVWWNGSGAPSNTIGANNDFYLDVAATLTTGDVYQKSGGAWAKIGNIRGPQGSGGITPVASVVAGENISQGQPVYVSQIDGKLYRAISTGGIAPAAVIGLARTTVTAASICDVEGESFTLSDWTLVVGAASLTQGSHYYLDSTAGKLTSAAPTVFGQTLIRVGIAATANTLAVEIGPRVLL